MANQTLSDEEILELLEEDNDMDVNDYEPSNDEGEIDHVSDASMSDSELSEDDVGAGVAQVNQQYQPQPTCFPKTNWKIGMFILLPPLQEELPITTSLQRDQDQLDMLDHVALL